MTPVKVAATFCFSLAGAAFGMMIWSMISYGIERDDRIEKSWQDFNARMVASGCKVTSYVPGTSGWIRPIWTCPDGHVEAGRAQ